MTEELQDYLFDLRGYLILENAVDAAHITDLNAALDAFPPLEWGHWHGNVQRFDNNGAAGVELQNILEGGEPFERLIDHPSWIGLLRRYCGEQGSYVQGLFIDIKGAVEVHLKKGDALLFVDALSHGASARTNPGERRAVIYHYGVSWGNTRHGYRYSEGLLARLSPERRKILQPIPPREPPAA